MKKDMTVRSISRILISVIVFLVFLFAGLKHLGSDDFSQVFKWWLTLLIVGIAVTPFTLIVFRNFHDGGWIFGKTIGLAISAWLVWFFSSFKIVKFTRTACVIAVVAVYMLSSVFYYFYERRRNRNASLRSMITLDRASSIVTAETVFFAMLVFWCYIKGILPDAYGTERFMDYGFMMSMSKSEYMPAADMWFSGQSINYYYVGQYIMTYLAKLAGVPVAQAYNIAMMSLAALAFSLSYSIGNNLMHVFLRDRAARNWSPAEIAQMQELGTISREDGQPFFRPAIAGMLSGLAVVFAGNMHYTIYKYIYPKVQYFRGDKKIYSYWFPDATRFVGYLPDRADKTIHEFPMYSFAIGDLHAHVINMIFVLTVLGLLLAWLMWRKQRTDLVRRYDTDPVQGSILAEVFHPAIVLCAFFVGFFRSTNYWDFPIYFVVCGAIILASNLILHRHRISAVLLTAYQAAMFIVVGVIAALPFIISFRNIASKIGWCGSGHHTLFKQLLVLWGLPVGCIIAFLVSCIYRHCRESGKRSEVLPRELESLRRVSEPEDEALAQVNNGFTRFLDKLPVSDLYVIILGLCAVGLVLLPELIYVRDIYGGAYIRANTMFKLTYQAFIMFGLCMAFIITRFVSMPRSRVTKAVGIIALVLFCTTLGYFDEAYTAWFKGPYKTLNATTFIGKKVSEAESEIIDSINNEIDGQCTILEMPGLSYTYFNRVSAFTGMPTVLGWQTHEWLWNSTSDISEYPKVVQDRHNDVITMYTSTDKKTVSELVEKYDVSYVFIGLCERVDGYYAVDDKALQNGSIAAEDTMVIEGKRCKKINVNIDTWKSLGEVEKELTDKATGLPIYLIKVDRELTQQFAGK